MTIINENPTQSVQQQSNSNGHQNGARESTISEFENKFKGQGAKKSPIKRMVYKLNHKRKRFSAKCRKASSRFALDDTYLWSAKEYTERQNSVGTLELFKYAKRRERLAVALGILSLWYAASWQPISVFILAIMASLMGQYSKQMAFLMRLNETSKEETIGDASGGQQNSSLRVGSLANRISSMELQRQHATNNHDHNHHQHKIVDQIGGNTNGLQDLMGPLARLFGMTSIKPNPSPTFGGMIMESPVYSSFVSTTTSGSTPNQMTNPFDVADNLIVASSATANQTTGLSGDLVTVAPSMTLDTSESSNSMPIHTSYDSHQFSLLAPLYSIISPMFDFGFGDSNREVEDILRKESDEFLRRSFEINGSAFMLALTQLIAFFIGMTLITWAAKKQASRVKILYFTSCLHQEVTWFESIDSAGGSGSSLNALVDKYEDGIGVKLALLCYFLGHVALFALTAFYQLFNLALFCMPFVLTVGLIIAFLSEWQAAAIGQHALFAKRSLQLAEEILAAIRTVFAFNGQQKELTRYSISLQPVYKRSLVKHLYTALNTSLSKFSIFACFSAYCFYAMRLFPPYDPAGPANKSTVLAVMRGAEVSIVNILISIPFMEALQQSKGSIARIYAAIERRSKIDATSERGSSQPSDWKPSISFRMVQFGYADRCGPTRRNSTIPFLNLPGSPGSGQQALVGEASIIDGHHHIHQAKPNICNRRQSLIEELADELDFEANGEPAPGSNTAYANSADSLGALATSRPRNNTPPAGGNDVANSATGNGVRVNIGKLAADNNNARVDAKGSGQPQQTQPSVVHSTSEPISDSSVPMTQQPSAGAGANLRLANRRSSAAIRRFIGNEIDGQKANNKRVLNYFNLEIKAGQSVALVGPSGSGKSTVLSLIQRLYDITGGQLLIGQHNIKDLRVSWLRNQISVVTQEPRLFDMTIAENIRLGLNEQQDNDLYWSSSWFEARIDDDLTKAKREANIMQQVVEAAREANAHEFIIRLPDGYATRVGSGGFQLSGGQKQRIAIARALIRKPKILLLDESTSALDTESESMVQQALKLASSGRTTITVAHRLSTIRDVDLIVVMSQGQVVECGTHDELMLGAESAPTGSGIYRQMYEQQLRSVRRVRPSSGGRDLEELESADKRKLSASKRGNLSENRVAGGNDCKAKSASSLGHFGPPSGETREEIEANGGSGADYANWRREPSDNGDISGEEDDEDDDEDDEDDYDDVDEYQPNDNDRPSAWQLWQFIEMPKWSSLAAVLICLVAGLILPMNLIAHSYLFSAFAYEELDQIGDYLHAFGLIILSFSSFVFIVTFLQILLPGYVGEKLSTNLRVKIMNSILNKPMFYFDMDANSAGSLCDRFNSYISSIQSIAGTRMATMIEAVSTLTAGAIFGFGQNLSLSIFCITFAVLVLITTIIESRMVQRESSLQQKFDAQLAHLMADALSNIKTIASLNKEKFFIARYTDIVDQRENGTGRSAVWLRTFLTSLKFVMPAMSWSASMYYGCHLLVGGRIDLQTIFIVCPVVLFAVNDTFRALVFLPELLKARCAIERLYKMDRDFSPEVLSTMSLGQQLEQQNRLHLEQLLANQLVVGGADALGAGPSPSQDKHNQEWARQDRKGSSATVSLDASGGSMPGAGSAGAASRLAPAPQTDGQRKLSGIMRPKKSISFIEPSLMVPIDEDESSAGAGSGHVLAAGAEAEAEVGQQQQRQRANSQAPLNRRLSNISALPTYMRRKSSRLNSLIPRAQVARGRIEFKDVEFAYPNRPSALVLDGFSLQVAPGESVALVGGSGSGKSTTVAILEKFYDYHAGNVSLDGHDLRLVEPNWVRSQIGLVSQEPTLLSYTIGDNIRYGDNSRFVSMDEVIDAARTANIHEFIMSLPDQYDTELSNSNYSGSQLSGGQRQRIAIARALIRNAPILIFDEATSALDNKSESVVQDALDKARKGRTSLTIAHRLATIKDADKIVVLKEGKVVEVGRHEELLREPSGHYRGLWERQEGSTT